MEDLSENFFENHRKSDRICVIVCVYLSLENNFLEVYHAYRTMANAGFVSKAPQKLIDNEKDKLEKANEKLAKLKDKLAMFD